MVDHSTTWTRKTEKARSSVTVFDLGNLTGSDSKILDVDLGDIYPVDR